MKREKPAFKQAPLFSWCLPVGNEGRPFVFSHTLSVGLWYITLRCFIREKGLIPGKEISMKRMVFGLSLALVAFGFFGSPAFAAGPQRQGVRAPSAADQEFLASLASHAPKGRAAAAAKPSSSGGGEKALCSATAACGGGVTVSCNSNSGVASCSSADRSCPERGHVTCNGATTWCPDPCPCSASLS